MNKFTGSNYDRSLSCKDIAQKVREFLKEKGLTKKNGYNISVKSPRYNYISVSILSIPFELNTPEYKEYSVLTSLEKKANWFNTVANCKCSNDWHDVRSWERHLFGYDGRYGELTKEALELKKMIKDLIDSYNYDNSDVMTDYFDSNFYSSVEYRLNGC